MLHIKEMKEEKKMVNFRVSEALAEDLREASEILEIPQSQIVREAVKEKVAAIKAARMTPQVETV